MGRSVLTGDVEVKEVSFSFMNDRIAGVLGHDRIRAARRHIERADSATLARQAELSAIPAPTGGEATRAARVAALFREIGLDGVGMDAAGNVVGRLQGAGSGERSVTAPVVLAAHLDTVFGTDVNVAVRQRGTRLEGPGISDNARGLAALVTVAEAMHQARVATTRPVVFAATVGEEGAGNLRGARQLLAGAPSPHAFIALDGAGISRVIHRALGVRRYRATYRGPGGHSWAASGVANPANAVGAAITALGGIPTHHSPRTTHAVVRLGGGTGLNSIPQEAWLDVDLRSESPEALATLDQAARAIFTRAVEEENRRRLTGTQPLTLDLQLVGDRPSGVTPRAHPLVQAAVAATRALGREPELASASTDANVAIAQGVPGVALGAGGQAGDQHLPSEWYDNAEGPLGIVRALLVTAAVAEVA
jgi:tripeptide aminopeptidase